jgi:small subunit ribosomal protein S16
LGEFGGVGEALVATKHIKLMRLGKMRAPYYRIVVADARTKRDGRAIEEIGKYHPKQDPSFLEVDGERAAYWLSVGAQPTEAVTAILKVSGDWQKFKGLPAPPPMLVAAPKADKKIALDPAAPKASAGTTALGGLLKLPEVAAELESAPELDVEGPMPSRSPVPQAKERTEFLIGALGSGAALARLLDVSRSQPARWRTGAEQPHPDTARELVDLDHIVARATLLWPPEVAVDWLTSANSHLDGARPIDVLRLRGASEVIDALDATTAGSFG